MTTAPHRSAADREAWESIPWVVAGTASPDERALVERHVAACADCAAELAFQRGVHAALASTSPGDSVDPEPGLRRLMARIDAGRDAAPRAGPRGRVVPSRWLAAAGVAMAVQAVALVVLGERAARRPAPADYTTLSRPETGRATVRLVPAPSMSLQELQALLGRFDLQIVEASADGAFYGLAPRHAGAPPSAALLEALRATPGVLLAETIVGAGDTRPSPP